MVAVPEVGLDTPVKIRMVVVLPAPLGPKKPKVSPSPTEKLISLTAVRELNFLMRWDTSIACMYMPFFFGKKRLYLTVIILVRV
jgi:hypothetical protein